jgi:XTP/dITP diphosphohydrolase
MSNLSGSFLKLVSIMDELREKCPWDRKQTIQTLRHMTIEETYELTDAITDEDWNGIKEELGDLLLHIVFYSKIGVEQNKFTLEEVINGISEKLISRHPHIYGDVKVNDEEDVKRNWEKLKLKEGKDSILSGVPKSLPATVKQCDSRKKQNKLDLNGKTRTRFGKKWKKKWVS